LALFSVDSILPRCAHDAGVAEQFLDARRREARDALEVEVRERAPEVLALAQDRQPAQPGLETLEADLLEQPLRRP
jgi:hypothetical protein